MKPTNTQTIPKVPDRKALKNGHKRKTIPPTISKDMRSTHDKMVAKGNRDWAPGGCLFLWRERIRAAKTTAKATTKTTTKAVKNGVKGKAQPSPSTGNSSASTVASRGSDEPRRASTHSGKKVKVAA